MSIEVENLQVRFGGVTALQNVTMTFEPRDIVAVIGPNGSGKSTLFNAITGLVNPAAGEIRVDGRDIVAVSPHRRIRMGLSRTFQTPRFDPHMSVQTAVLCGFYAAIRTSLAGALLRIPSASREERDLHRRGEQILHDLGLIDLRGRPMGELPIGQVRLVDIARALAAQPRYLLLDEPAAGLSKAEQHTLADQILRLAERGVGVLLVEHNFHLVKSLARHVIVLERGSILVSGTAEEVSRQPEFIRAYLGSSPH